MKFGNPCLIMSPHYGQAGSRLTTTFEKVREFNALQPSTEACECHYRIPPKITSGNTADHRLPEDFVTVP